MGRPPLPKDKKKEVYTYRTFKKVKEKADKKADRLKTSVSEKIQEWLEIWVTEK